MTRAAIYARFSSDNQNEKSIDDQIVLCRELCAREGLSVVATFDDRAISGSSIVNRPGYQAMMRAAEAGLFDVLVAEDMDRVFRDQGDYHTARKRLDFLGVSIHTASGKVTRIDGALRALMGEMYIENLVLHVRRGLEGVIRDGRRAGGKAYGYTPIPGKPGESTINEAEAAVVRRIFAEYIDGKTPRDIAYRLNVDKIKPPQGIRWNASTINGNVQRGSGLLLNEIYTGEIVWNKVRMVKDPSTGKRISRPNSPDQWKRAAAPQLRIIDDATWSVAQSRKVRNQAKTQRKPAVASLLSGLLKCGSCGSGMTSLGHRLGVPRIQCSAHKENGSCDNSRMFNREAVEKMVLEGLADILRDPGYLKAYMTAFNEERSRLARGAVKDKSKLQSRSGEVAREIERLLDAIIKIGVDPKTVAGRLRDLETERDEIAASLDAASRKDKVVTLHPAAINSYLADVERLRKAFADSDAPERPELHEPLRRLLHSVVVKGRPGEKDFKTEIKGRLQELIGAPFPKGGEQAVAREGYIAAPTYFGHLFSRTYPIAEARA